MSEQPTKAGLIKTRGQAGAVVCVTLFLAGHRFWELAKHGQPKSDWYYSGFSKWFDLPANVLTYILFAAFFITAIREFRGTERIILAILIGEVLVSPIRQYLPLTIAQAVVWIQASAGLVMLLAAIRLFLSVSEKQSSSA